MNLDLTGRWLSVVLLLGAVQAAEVPDGQDLEFFETRIRPVLVNHCYACHSAEAKTRMGGLSLDTRDGIREGGQRGHAVVPHDVDSSLILDALRYEGALRMPPTGRLSEAVADDFEKWVRMGAPDPRAARKLAETRTMDLEEGREYWAFRRPLRSSPPAVGDLAWPYGTIDQHVLAALEADGLRPVADAGRADLLRRVSLDLTGLPPTAAELEAFLADGGERSYAAVVERLLESPRFGERWGRHWLDVVRYADTVGRTRNLPFPVAWRYRDYVIGAFNDDKPYDEFIREQVAGDLLAPTHARDRIENQIATGFLALGAHDLNEQDPKQFEMDVADEMINVTSRSFLALSVGCARCHDHKFDPVPTADYYALAGIFRSSELRSGLRRRPRFNAGYFQTERLVTLDGVPEFASADAGAVRAERERLRGLLEVAEQERNRIRCRELSRELGKLPLPENLAMGVVDAPDPVPVRINVGGDPHTLGAPVDRGFVQVLFPDGFPVPRVGGRESGRLQLAEWLTHADNPLTARVMVNRIWHHMLGRGLVPTVDNFGKTGRPPSNQALLDYLAVQFMDQGWSVKSLVREIALSRTYRLSTAFDAGNFAVDPDNARHWRAHARRLEAEALRDSVLLVSGELRQGPPTEAPVNGFDRNQLINPGNRQVRAWDTEEAYRSVYVPVIRNLPSVLFESFDFPEPSETRGVRAVTTGPGQALFMMNSRFVQAHSAIAAERLLAQVADERLRVRRAFQQVLARDPSPAEANGALDRIRETRGMLVSRAAEAAYHVTRERAREVLAAALDREVQDTELSTAMKYMDPGPGTDPDGGRSRGRESGLQRDTALGMVEAVVGRPLTIEERRRVGRQVRKLKDAGERGRESATTVAGGLSNPQQEAWSRLYHALYNTAEFRYRN